VRFVFVSFVGEGIGVMRRAKISTLRGNTPTLTLTLTPSPNPNLNPNPNTQP
jgi:hypothetical protein|tara:strand:+ start:102 stop:257 length:156 start_codon:yes stop_codon:yes gene_type:complete